MAHPQPPRPTTFFDLPTGARKKIYRAALVRRCLIDLGPVQPAEENRGSPRDCHYLMRTVKGFSIGHGSFCVCFCLLLVSQLLRVSRAIHDEAFPMLYGENLFVFRSSSHTQSDLGPLLAMPAGYLAEMTTLLLRLNTWPCFRGDDDIRQFGDNPPRCVLCDSSPDIADPAWTSSPSAATGRQLSLLEQRRQLCGRLASILTPGRLRLTLVCDVDDLSTGKLVTGPLLQLPRLRECTLRLGRRKEYYDLATLARETSVTMTKRHEDVCPQGPPSALGFADLPRELRLQILEYTDLDSRLRNRRVEPRDANRLPPILKIVSGRLILGHPWKLFNDICCWKCTPSFKDCCCPTAHASYAPGCVCRVIPFELFRVSHQMYQDATEVFYTASNFYFAVEDHGQTLAFLKKLPPAALGFIRRFTICFLQEHFEEWKSDEKKHGQQFKRLIEFIRDGMDVSRLHLTVDLRSIGEEAMWNDEDQEENRYIYDVYLDITNMLCMLRGLKGLEVDVEYGKGGMKLWMTREVLGDRYDSMGLPEPVPPTEEEKIDVFNFPPWHRLDLRVPDSNYVPR